MPITYVPVKGKYVNAAGAPLGGTVVFTPDRPIVSGSTTLSDPTTFTLNSSGEIPDGSTVARTDDVGYGSITNYYTVVENVGGTTRTYTTRAGAGHGTVDLGVNKFAGIGVSGTTTVALTDAATVVIDAAKGRAFKVVIAGNRTLGNPSNGYDGQTIVITVQQDATGNRTVTLGNKYRLASGVTLSWSTTASRKDKLVVQYDVTDDKWDVLGFQPGFG